MVAVVAVLCGACTTTIYRSYDQPAGTGGDYLGRRVNYFIDRALYAAPPECVVILPSEKGVPARLARLVEPALARHLGGKFPRVIGSVERRRAERRLALNLEVGADRVRFARQTVCNGFVRWKVLEAADEYFFVWSQRRIGLEVAIFRGGDEKLLWRASHTGSRSDGSLPLSPLSLPFAAFEAARFNGDDDVLPSMIDDVARRIVVTLPDVRYPRFNQACCHGEPDRTDGDTG